MKRFLSLIILFFILLVAACKPASLPEVEEPINILFIGNSYTFVNEMPEIFAELAELGEHNVKVTTLAKAGYSLDDHVQDPQTRRLIRDENWDYVILQEKSSLPVLDIELMAQGVSQLIELAADQNSETILFMPWAYQSGFPEAGLADYQAMQSKVAETYLDLGQDFDISVAPVGIAWQKLLENEPELDLWNPDGSHPTWRGSFLAASTFYALLFQESPAGLWEPDRSVDAEFEITRLLEETAAETVIGNPGLWKP